ncbi:hypothetical protein GOP47_0013117 [Adiantum capillus-veneris]|uniref:Uncharacterized protein n=1 Tax=Adiantum capillus-veneris TaxID=13818 RepID=A0A9D4US56_ADICA|nr:hypothetical protein GOP47_0012845 [Adiantum capillus-veneris]KAI5073011.1 hypothetical protein GOP47_0013117 [Adiantum capillus-veneris]
MSASRSERAAFLLNKWKEIEALEEDDEHVSEQEFSRCKESWFVQAFLFFQNLPLEEHCWCVHHEIAWPLLEPFYSYYQVSENNSVKVLWRRFSQELRKCTRCVLQYYKAKELYATEFLEDIVGTLLAVLRKMDEERVATHLHEILCKMKSDSLNSEKDSEEIICVLFEVMRFPALLDDAEIDSAFIKFLQYVENTYDLSLATDQCYAGVYALFFHNDQATRRIALRLAGAFGKLRTAGDLEPIQPVLQKHMHYLEFDLFDSKKAINGKASSDVDSRATEEPLSSSVAKGRPRAQCTRESLWIGLKTLLGMLEPAAFEEGVVERYPVFLSIVLNHASEASPVFWNALHCLKLLLDVLGYKLWIKTTFSPGVMRSTLIGQCFHTREEKMHKAIFDLFQPFLQSLEALQDGEYERQRRNILYFLLQQVGHSRNFSGLMSKKASQIAFLIILRGFKMDPACPPMECVHVWGPSLLESVKDTQLYDSLRAPAVQLLETILIADSVVLSYLHSRGSQGKNSLPCDTFEQVEEVPEIDTGEYTSYLNQHKALDKLGENWNSWLCAPILWVEILEKVLPSDLPEPFSQAVLWASSRMSLAYVDELAPRDVQTRFHREVGFTNTPVSSLIWETPKGCDDGADGKLCPNTVVAREHVTQLVLLLKKCVGTFLGQIQLTRVSGSWIWDPHLAEVLVLLSLDSYEKVRDFGRYLLAHFANDSSLDSGLIFLCSNQASATCAISGLFYAIKLLMMSRFQETVSCSQNLLFLARKVIAFWQRDLFGCSNSPKILKASASASEEGGFLKQPNYDQHLRSVDIAVIKEKDLKRETNLLQVSSFLWPYLLKVMKDGYPYAEDPAYLTLFTRLFDLFPSVFQNILFPLVELEHLKNFVDRIISDTERAWIFDFVSWGDVSIVSIHRRWKLAVSAILTSLSKADCMEELEALKQAHDWLETGGALGVQIKEKLEMLLCVALSRASKNAKRSFPKVQPSIVEAVSHRAKEPNLYELDKGVAAASSKSQDVIVLSDDESECSYKESIVCKPATNRLLANTTAENDLSLQLDKAPISQPRKHVHPISFQKQLETLHGGRVKKTTLDNFFGSSSRKPVETTPAVKLPISSAMSNAGVQEFSKKGSSVVGSIVALEEKSIVPIKGNDALDKKIEEKANQSLILERVSEQRLKDSLDSVLKELIQDEPNKSAVNAKPVPAVSKKGIGLVTNPQLKRQLIQLHVPNEHTKGNITKAGIAARPPLPRLDEWYKRILSLDYFSVVGLSSDVNAEITQADPMLKVPLVFRSSQHYMDVFRPLVLEEFRAQLQQSYDQLNISDETTTGSLRLMSLEKVDDFDVGRFTAEAGADGPARASFENDLLLLSRQPFQSCEQAVHMIGKVERQERDNKKPSVTIILKFYLRSGNKRLAKARTLLLERSKWHATRLMSITPQLREFQALSAVEYLPLLPVILNDGSSKMGPLSIGAAHKQAIQGLPEKLQHRLRADFNASQIHSIQMALRSAVIANGHELSLVQGPPGTGKTRTILAIVSALMASIKNLHDFTAIPKSDNPINATRAVSRSVAISRSWQAAALAKQQMQLEESENMQKDRDRKTRILICAQSNAAVDELVFRMCKDGLYDSNGDNFRPFIVRVGNAKTVHPNCLPVFIDTLVENQMESDKENGGGSNMNKSNTELIRKKHHKILDDIQELETKLSKLQNTDAHSRRVAGQDSVSGADDPEGDLKMKVNVLYKQRRQTYAELAALEAGEKRSLEETKRRRLELKRNIIRRAEVVVATLSGCGGDVYSACIDKSGRRRQLRTLDDGLFDAVVIDEAAQALEPATLIPLQLLKTSHAKCIMVGDPKQLPATVISQMASRYSFECSLFERLQKGGHPVSLLNVQYRMHPDISEFPSAFFYESQLEDARTLLEERKAVFHENKFSGPYFVFDVVEGYEKVRHQSTSQSLVNEAEAEVVLEIFRNLRTRYPGEIRPGKVGIITPYQQQLSLLRERFKRVLGQTIAQGIEFNTVDGFQGREVDILIFSTVRGTSRNGQSSSRIGFVADVRRMNVALTRARFSLWIVCNAATLQASPPWAALLQNAKERGLLHRVKGPYGDFFEKGCFDERREQNESSFKKLSTVSSDHINARVDQVKAKNDSGEFSMCKGSDSVHRSLQRSDTAENSLNRAAKGVNMRDYAIKGTDIVETAGERSFREKARYNENKEVEAYNQTTLRNRYETNSDKLQCKPLAATLESEDCDSRKPSEILSVVNSSRESKGQVRSHKSEVQEQHLNFKTWREVDKRHGHREGSDCSKQETGGADKSTAGPTQNLMQTVEQKKSQELVSVSEDKYFGGALNPRRKVTGPDKDKRKVGTGGVVATRSDLGTSQDYSLHANARVISTCQVAVDNATNKRQLNSNDIETEVKISRPSKRSRHDKAAGLTLRVDTQITKRIPSGEVQHVEDWASSSEDCLNAEWIHFLKVLNESKIRFPLP